jgi:hypothetical protein
MQGGILSTNTGRRVEVSIPEAPAEREKPPSPAFFFLTIFAISSSSYLCSLQESEFYDIAPKKILTSNQFGLP